MLPGRIEAARSESPRTSSPPRGKALKDDDLGKLLAVAAVMTLLWIALVGALLGLVMAVTAWI